MDLAAERKCANCGHPAPLRYCPSCGQKVSLKPPTVLEIFHEFYSQFTKIDSKGIQTLIKLVTQPGRLSKDFIEGKRSRYLAPLKVYLLISAFYVAAFWAYSPNIEDMNRLATQRGEPSVHHDLGYAQLFIPKAPVEVMRARSYEFFNYCYRNIGPIYVLLLPFFAAVLRLLYWKRELLYVEHLVFAAHFLAFTFLALISEPFLQRQGLTWIPYVVASVYLLPAMKLFYGQSWPKTVAKALLFVAGMTLLILLTVFGLAAYFMLR